MNKQKMDLSSKIKNFKKCAQASTSNPVMEIVITPLVDPKKQPAVEGLNNETTRGCNLWTKNSTGSRVDQLKASAKAPSLYGGDSAKGGPTPSHLKGRQQNTDFTKVGLRRKKAHSELDVPEHSNLRSIQEMLSLLKAFPRSFPQQRVDHLPSHSIGGQVKDKRFSPVSHITISTGTLMLNGKGQCESIESLMRNTDFKSQRLPEFYHTLKSTLGPKQSTRLSYPSYTISQRIHARPARHAYPSPTYNIVLADRLVLQNSASYSIGQRRQGIWKGTGNMLSSIARKGYRQAPVPMMYRELPPSPGIAILVTRSEE
ncbi:uncharacterized protein [Scyliorhinus torazame]|uniref:uncharacterized protein isoform X2 n=1 Tax=Scyliorhinus torazame TaxID=75743 RepID=UPI003B59672C